MCSPDLAPVDAEQIKSLDSDEQSQRRIKATGNTDGDTRPIRTSRDTTDFLEALGQTGNLDVEDVFAPSASSRPFRHEGLTIDISAQTNLIGRLSRRQRRNMRLR